MEKDLELGHFIKDMQMASKHRSDAHHQFHEKNSNKNHNEILLYIDLLQWLKLKRVIIPSVDEDVKELEYSYTTENIYNSASLENAF